MQLWEVTTLAKAKNPEDLEEAYVFCETKTEAIEMVRKEERLPDNKRMRAVEVTSPRVIIAFYYS